MRRTFCLVFFVIGLLKRTEAQICAGVNETDGQWSTFPSYDHSSIVLHYNTTSQTECSDACKRTLGCKSYYFGSELICGSPRLVKTICSLFPVPFRLDLPPINLISTFSSASSAAKFAVSGNVNQNATAGAGWWYFESTGLRLRAPANVTSAAMCQETCGNNTNCKSWSYSLYAGKYIFFPYSRTWLCEHFADSIIQPAANETWKSYRIRAPWPFGGYSANVIRPNSETPRGCSESCLRSLYDEHDECQLKEFRRTGNLTITRCNGTANAVLKRITQCLVPPAGADRDRFRIGQGVRPDCTLR